MDVVEGQRGGGLSGRAWARNLAAGEADGAQSCRPHPKAVAGKADFPSDAMRSHQKDFSRRVA